MKDFRFAPTRSGVQVASSWKLLARGNQFYLTPRSDSLGKISFHSGGSWRFHLGTFMTELAPPLDFGGGWQHALELRFLVDNDRFRPSEPKGGGKVQFFELPERHALTVNILFADALANRGALSDSLAGRPFWQATLRNGSKVAATVRAVPWGAADTEILETFKRELRVHYRGDLIPFADVFVEASQQYFDPVGGNVIIVAPLGPESLAPEESQNPDRDDGHTERPREPTPDPAPE